MKILEAMALDEKMKNSNQGLIQRIGFQIVRSRPLFLTILIVLLCIYMTYLYPISFPSFSNISALLINLAVTGILVVGMTILMVGGVFDLSIGATLALCGVVTGVLISKLAIPTTLAIILGVGIGALAGAINGWIVTRFQINALIATLATTGIFRGITQLISGTGVAPIGDDFAKVGQTVVLGFQTPFWVMMFVVVLGSWVVSQTRFFRQFYYVGGNERAAKLSGIKSNRVLFLGFVIMGLLAGVAGVLGAARLNAAVVSAGIGVELQIITAAILGGASLKGGEGTVLGAFLGALFIALIQNALIIMKVDVFWQNIVIGVVLLFAVSLDRLKQKTRS